MRGRTSEHRLSNPQRPHLEKILAARDAYPQRNAFGHDNRARVKALVLTLRYSGMRIGDVVELQKAHLKGDKLFLNTQKSGSKIYVPLPKTAVDALAAIETTGQHFFWTGKGLCLSARSATNSSMTCMKRSWR